MIDDDEWPPTEPYSHRNEGIHLVSGRGTGKSVFLGISLASRDVYSNMPVIIFDTGSLIDNLLNDLFTDESIQVRRSFFSRIRYINMAGMPTETGDYLIVPFPLYHRYGSETDDIIANRLVSAFRRLHPELESAQVQGMPRFEDVAMDVGMELVRKGLQLDSALAILEAGEVVEKGSVEVFKVRVKSLLRNPIQKAIYTSTPPGISWDEVFQKKLVVLFDFGGLTHESQTIKRFAIIWVLWDLLNFIDRRGANYTDPVSIIIDEFKALTTPGAFERQEVFAEDLDYILNTLMRQRNVWLTVAHQQMTQFSSRIRGLLMGMKTQIVGRPETREDAAAIARELFPTNPNIFKSSHVRDMSTYSIEEQVQMNAERLLRLEKFHFLVKNPAINGGDITEIRKIPTSFPDPEVLAFHKRDILELYGKRVSFQAQPQAPEPAMEQSVTTVTKPLPIRTKGKLKS